MAGKLVQVATETVTSAVASVSLTGIDSDDVYMVAMNNVQSASTSGHSNLTARVLTGGTPQTDSNYDNASKGLWANSTFQNKSSTNQPEFIISGTGMDGTGTSESFNSIIYLFNFNNSSEYSFITLENTSLNADGQLYGQQGGAVKTTAEANNGIEFKFLLSKNIASGTFTLYKVV